MSAVTVNETRLKRATFTNTYLSPRLVFVVEDQLRKKFATMESVLENPKIEIAILKGSAFESSVKELFPNKKVIYLNNYADFNPEGKLIALLWEENEAIAWMLTHRNFRVIFPQPIMGHDSFAYAIRSDSPRFLQYLNQWMELKKTQGFTSKQYDLWIKGKTEIVAPVEPRWSVIRNVLHWID